jgi:2-keto-3-deoxy-L-rhamnonate aldolase RhmA
MLKAAERFRKELKDGKKSIGIGITLSDPLLTDAIADSVDFLGYDLEHASMSPENMYAHLAVARGKNKPGIVRVTDGTTALIKAALDGGADGIIVPQVRTVEEVERIVGDCRYPPLGVRGFGPRVPSNYGRSQGADYLQAANQNLFVAVMIENADALQAVDAIACIHGLDSLVIGPADLSLSLGESSVYSARTQDAMRMIIAAALSAGKFIGAGMGVDVKFALHLAEMGVQWLQVGQDFDHLVKGMDAVYSAFHQGWDSRSS